MYRSWLFIPGNRDKHLRKAIDLEADVIIYDLEDAVPDEDKQLARLKVKETMTKANHQVNIVRVNGLDTNYFVDDLHGIVSAELTGLMLPKVNSRDDVLIADYLLGQLEVKHGIKKGTLVLLPLIETAKGIENVSEIAGSSERILCLCFGAEDYMLELNLEADSAQTALNYARSKLVVASAAAKKAAPVDAVYPDFHDEAGLEAATIVSKQAGFQGKLLIHPKQIDIVNHIFSPTQKEIDEAKRIVEIYTASIDKGEGAIQLDGKMIDVPIAERARRLLAYAKRTV
ncbi:HpcH/HpaI aldolase/citrate lyase family protein [Oceanobacillus alkalisoli]|uniref:HpcH/HpaI aldolase/citrate lyase family protein n=1 Tax=Oceanobacillus alkalisoli TaxID=2925113 RepID=UPI001EF0487A|nr:CoA ester lyase [Oceanobacillus alkalisoli]MCF3943751.1 CoA ester lyase [Oceanobacillus alkalisoli]MCG5103691.1 CoA ester lyase [Oceanobacillus alkalisoli]